MQPSDNLCEYKDVVYILDKEIKFKLEVRNKRICDYMNNGQLDLNRVIKDYTNYVYTIIDNSYLKPSKEDIEEIISDVFVILWNNQQKLNINSAMSSYIAGITKNLIRQKIRYIKSDCNIEDYEDTLVSSFNLDSTFFLNDSFNEITNLIKSIKPEDQRIFTLYYYQQKKIKEICLICNMSETKVKSKLFRIRKKLQKILKKNGDDFNE